MAVTGPSALGLLAVAALAVAFFSASQDIVIDAYRTDVLRREELGPGAAVFVTGYRIAVIAVGAGALALADIVPWPVVYLALAATMAACVAATFLSPEPEAPPAPPASLREAVLDPFREFLRRDGGWLVLLFPLFFKAPDIVAGRMTLPFLLDIGFSKTEVAAVRQALGMGVTIVATLLGGGFVARFGIRRSLWVFGVLQAVSNLGFWVLAETGPVRSVLIGVIAVENFCGGLVTAGYLTFLMSQCDHRYTAVQFALLTSLGAVARDLGGAPVGYAAAALGWPVFFMASVLTAVPGMLLIPWLRIREADAEPRAPGGS
jgi:PAT family beta-lactamase induction signal transducer AmpG